jgi:hypothetical protein
MSSPAALALNRSAHTLGDLTALAKASPGEATSYLKAVAAALKRTGAAAQAQAVEKLLAGAGSLYDRIAAAGAQLTGIFPKDSAGWAALAKMQGARASSIGFEAHEHEAPLPVYVKGTVKMNAGGLQLTTTGGKTLALAESFRNSAMYAMKRYLMAGLIDDGEMVLQGTLGSDGKTFSVEGFALNRGGRYESFTFGRVVVEGDDVTLDTPRGDVKVTDPAFKARLKAMPRLGVILPGEWTTDGDQKTYEGNPHAFFALARLKEATIHAADHDNPQPWVRAEMAWSEFENKPMTVPKGYEKRVAENDLEGRIWVEGDVQLAHDGSPARFVADYVSVDTDGAFSALVGAYPDASPVQTAVMLAEA